MYWMWRRGWEYQQLVKFGLHAGELGTGDGVQWSAVHLNRHLAPY